MSSTELIVDGIVSHRNKQPYIRLFNGDTQIGQLSMAEARNFAHDILTMCARTEADAMIYKFFAQKGLPEGAEGAIMIEFRDFRMNIDSEFVEQSFSVPPGEEPPPKGPSNA